MSVSSGAPREPREAEGECEGGLCGKSVMLWCLCGGKRVVEADLLSAFLLLLCLSPCLGLLDHLGCPVRSKCPGLCDQRMKKHPGCEVKIALVGTSRLVRVTHQNSTQLSCRLLQECGMHSPGAVNNSKSPVKCEACSLALHHLSINV